MSSGQLSKFLFPQKNGLFVQTRQQVEIFCLSKITHCLRSCHSLCKTKKWCHSLLSNYWTKFFLNSGLSHSDLDMVLSQQARASESTMDKDWSCVLRSTRRPMLLPVKVKIRQICLFAKVVRKIYVYNTSNFTVKCFEFRPVFRTILSGLIEIMVIQ